MIKLKFAKNGTNSGIASSLASMLMYLAAMHTYKAPVKITNDPVKDYWDLHKRLQLNFEKLRIPSVEKEFQFDEQTDGRFKMFADIVNSDGIRVKEDVEAIIRLPFSAEPYSNAFYNNIGRMCMLSQIIHDEGSYWERPRLDTKTRGETLAKEAFAVIDCEIYYTSSNLYLKGSMPYSLFTCGETYDLLVTELPEDARLFEKPKLEEFTW